MYAESTRHARSFCSGPDLERNSSPIWKGGFALVGGCATTRCTTTMAREGRAGLSRRSRVPAIGCARGVLLLRDEQGERYDGDPVGASVALGAGVEHDGVDAVVAELVAEPVQVRDMGVVDGC